MSAQNTPRRNQDTSQRASNRKSGAQAIQTRQSVQNDEQHPPSNNLPSDQTAPEQEYSDYLLDYDEDDAALNAKIPDVLLDAPVVQLNNLDFELDDLRAKVALFAKVLELVELSVGIDAWLGNVKLTIESVNVQALLKVRLDNVTAIIDRVLTTVDRNPQIVHELVSGVSSAVRDFGAGTGEALEEVGAGAGSAVEDVGEGAGEAVEGVGDGASEALGEVGEGAGQAARQVAQGAGEIVDEVGQGAGQAARQEGQVAQGATDQAGQSAQGAPGELQDEVKVTPSAERLAQQLGVDLSEVEGTGGGGYITVRDVRSAAH
jgi:e3 binding domain